MVRQGDPTRVFSDGAARYTLARDVHGTGADEALGRTLERHEARWALQRALPRALSADIVGAYRALVQGPLTIVDELDAQRMGEALLDAAVRGDLQVYELRQVGSSVERDVEVNDEPVRAAQAPKEVKTWVEIVLVDDDEPPQPVRYAKYRIELPDRSTREGILSDNGRARIEGIDPGTCRVTFPGLDGREWKVG
jgi:hypothetical protein